MVLLQRKLYFSKDPKGVQYFPGGGGGGGGGGGPTFSWVMGGPTFSWVMGGPTFSWVMGGPNAYFYRNPYHL